jgi:hypothetical protein
MIYFYYAKKKYIEDFGEYMYKVKVSNMINVGDKDLVWFKLFMVELKIYDIWVVWNICLCRNDLNADYVSIIVF